MKNEDVDSMLGNVDVPHPENIQHQQELKIPLLRYKRSSKAGLWLLVLPIIVVLTSILKRELAISSPFLNGIGSIFRAIDGNPILTFLIPLVVLGLPCAAIVINLLAFSHFTLVRERRELLITFKYRPVNIAIFLLSFAILVFVFMPDALTF
ncbi:MAG: hypothetical protein KF749_03025 [Bacteroidetes bacterium]|nr:hypothetical protein [Bacteroidota bacterium]MCW5896789.1 hypothetical protein [Bacteroidota bacterium]